jgi:hypothetical protein
MSYLTTKSEIKEELRRNLERLTDYPAKADDLVAEIAEGFTPLYNNDIMTEWAALPMEDSDMWKEYGFDTQRNEGGILRLMSVDLAIYYLRIGAEAWAELQIEIGEIAECPRHEGSFDCTPFCAVCDGEQHYKLSDTLPCQVPACDLQLTKDIWLEEMGFCVEHQEAFFNDELDPITLEPKTEIKKESE